MDSPPRYAVLFKTHFWDDYVERQFRRLCRVSGRGRVFIMVDETKWPVTGIQYHDTIRITEKTSEAEGYLRYPAGNLFWYNTDYPMYHFLDQHPEYDFIFVCEYDCVINIEIACIIDVMARDNLEFVAKDVSTPTHEWPWAVSVRYFYPEQLVFHGRLVCSGAFSRNFARKLQAARRDHTRRALKGAVPDTVKREGRWPMAEAFIGAEIARLGVAEAPLSDFGDVSNYDWAPPHPEFAMSVLSKFAFAHPVLDNRSYIRAIRKVGWKAQDLFEEGSGLQRAMERYDAADVVPMFARHFLTAADFDSLQRLRLYAGRRGGGTVDNLFNVALGQPATQSSTSQWSRRAGVAHDATGAVNGLKTGDSGFQTNLDPEPWWCVDLEITCPVQEIRIYNRINEHVRSRSPFLVVSCSSDLIRWRTLHAHTGDTNFGGADGMPLRIEMREPVQMRFLRLHLPKEGFLHLDEVEVYV